LGKKFRKPQGGGIFLTHTVDILLLQSAINLQRDPAGGNTRLLQDTAQTTPLACLTCSNWFWLHAGFAIQWIRVPGFEFAISTATTTRRALRLIPHAVLN